MILLTATEANQVRGQTISGHAVAPKPLVKSGASTPALNGRFALPEEVITDAAHQIHSNYLQNRPTVPDGVIHNGVQPPGPPGSGPLTDCDWEQDPARCALYAYDPATWTPGKIIVINE